MRKKEGISIQITGKQLTILISGIFFISVLSFVCGGLLVKRFNPTVQASVSEKTVVVSPGKKKEHKGRLKKNNSHSAQKRMTFFDTLPDKRKRSIKNRMKSPVVASAAKKVSPPSEIIPKRAVPRLLPPKETPQKRVETVKGGAFSVQVVSYRKKKQAQDFISLLSKKGYNAYLVETSIPQKGVYYRVRIGPYSEKNAALKVAKALFRKEKKALKIGMPMVIKR